MSCSNEKENVIISPPDQGKREIDIRKINMKNLNEITEELDRLKNVRMNWNINTQPTCNINYDDYGLERRAEYRALKDKFYLDYKMTCQEVNENIKNLQAINTDLCFEIKKEEDDIKIKAGTFFSADEQAYLDQEEAERKESRADAQAKYYDNNKEKIKKTRRRKILKEKINFKTEGIDMKMVRGGVMIKPLCQCGRLCDIANIKTIEKHSQNDKHLLFKSVIKYIHFKRQNRKLKKVIKKINDDYIKFKKVERKDEDGVRKTSVTKKDIDIVKLYNSYLRPYDENITHEPREAYINKVEYNEDYELEIFDLRHQENKRTSNKVVK